MRQEGVQSGTSNGQVSTGASASGMSGIIGDSSSITHQSAMDDIHQHIHSQTAQTLNFGDIY